MKLRRLLLVSSLGLVAGMGTAALTKYDSASSTASPSVAGPGPGGGSPGRPGVQDAVRLAFPGDDGRVARVLSALQIEGHLEGRSELYLAVQEVRAHEFPELVKYVSSTSRADRHFVLRALVQRWFEVDAPAAGAWAAERANESSIASMWAAADPDGVLKAAIEGSVQDPHSIATQALQWRYPDDRRAQYERVRQFPPGPLRDVLKWNVMITWASTDPKAVLAIIEELPEGSRESVLVRALTTLSRQDVDAALEQFAAFLPTMKAGVLGNPTVKAMSREIASKDPRRAMEWLSELPPEFGTPASVHVARAWASQDPAAALDWCIEQGVDITMPEWTGNGRWQPAMLASAMAKAPEETFARLAEMPVGAERDRMLECAFMESLWHTPREKYFQDGERTAWEFYEQLGEEAQITKATLFAQRRVEHAEMKDLHAWVQNFPAGLARENAIKGAIKGAYGRGVAQAEAMVATLPTGPERNAALFGLARSMGSSDPAQAATRALEISNPVIQQDALETIIVPWLTSKPDESRQWLEANPAIPSTLKQQWLQGR